VDVRYAWGVATILILAHEFDRLAERAFLVKALFPHWEAMGHAIVMHEGLRDLPVADAVLLHLDSTLVPDEYIEALRAYPVSINAGTRDIGKRTVSTQLVGPRDEWQGQVIIKTNANAGGLPERMQAEVARRGSSGGELPQFATTYPIYRSLDRVPAQVFADPALVVEKFLPERDPRGYASRHWIFFGDREWCTRIVSPNPLVKGADVIERTYVEVPEEIRAHRKRLGFDYGKFDFVIHAGRPVFLDANRTPTLPAKLSDRLRNDLAELARGLETLL
jgi:hypothetical protein